MKIPQESKYSSVKLPIAEADLSQLVEMREGFEDAFASDYHGERNHQGKDNRILFPSRPEAKGSMEAVRCRERLGGLLKYYEREAA